MQISEISQVLVLEGMATPPPAANEMEKVSLRVTTTHQLSQPPPCFPTNSPFCNLQVPSFFMLYDFFSRFAIAKQNAAETSANIVFKISKVLLLSDPKIVSMLCVITLGYLKGKYVTHFYRQR